MLPDGVKRRSSLFNTERVDHIYQDPHASDRRFVMHYGDLNDASSLNRILRPRHRKCRNLPRNRANQRRCHQSSKIKRIRFSIH